MVYWLIPYSILLVQESVRFLLLDTCLELEAMDNIPYHSWYRFKAQNIKWYKWLQHGFKDWLVLGALGIIAAGELLKYVALLLPVGLGVLALLILVRILAQGILLLYAVGTVVPGGLLKLALILLLPGTEPAGSKRVLLWSGAFILAGSVRLGGWVLSDNPASLLLGMVPLALGFVSLLRAVENRRELEDKGDAATAS